MTSTPRATALPVAAGAVGIWAALMALSFLTGFVQGSPINSDSGVGLLSVWAGGAVVGVALLVAHRRRWATAWFVATAGTVVGFCGFVFLYLLAYGT